MEYTKENPLVIKDINQLGNYPDDMIAKLHAEGAIKIEGFKGGVSLFGLDADPNAGGDGGDPNGDGGHGNPNGGGSSDGGIDPNAGAGGGSIDENAFEAFLKSKLGEDTTLAGIIEQRQKLQEAQEKIGKYENAIGYVANPFANDDLAKVNAFVKKTGINDLLFASRVVKENGLNEIPDEDLLVLKKKRMGIALPDDEIRKAIREQYEYDEDTNTYRRSSSLKMDAEETRIDFKKMAEDLQTANNVDLNALQEERKRKNQEKLSRWDNELKLLQLSPLESAVKYGEKPEEQVPFKVPVEYISSKLENIQQVVMALEPNDEGKSKVKSFIENTYLLENRDKIFSTFAAELQRKMDAQYHAAQGSRDRGSRDGQQKTDWFAQYEKDKQSERARR